MTQYDPMNRFITGYRTSQKIFDTHAESLDPLNVDDRLEFTKAMQEMQMAQITVDLALKSRNGLLRKALDKIG
jgi:hypothetical protein